MALQNYGKSANKKLACLKKIKTDFIRDDRRVFSLFRLNHPVAAGGCRAWHGGQYVPVPHDGVISFNGILPLSRPGQQSCCLCRDPLQIEGF